MQCTSCRHDNPEGARFCNGCGQSVVASCATCGTKNPPGARFCNQCGTELQGVKGVRGSGLGDSDSSQTPNPATPNPLSYTPRHLAEKILTTRSTLEGERKQVTVLFADVKGSMELAEQLDAEEWHKLLDRFFQILTDGVHRFEGTVNQYTGDGIMALFGAPIAHEDHAQRACYAALYLRDELGRYADELRISRGLSFSVRMGLHSGEVVVGKIGDDLRMDYTAQGHTVGLAARMQQIAAPDRAYLTDDTAKLVAGFFSLRDLGESTVKGARDPVRIHELEGVGPLRTRFDVSRARGLSRFVGRASEMATLEAALEQAIAGNGQVVGIVAEAGIGKSRLCYELATRCRVRGIVVREGHGVAHGKTVPLIPVLQILRDAFGIEPTDAPRTVQQKIAGALALFDESSPAALPLLFDLFGVPDPARPVPPIDPEVRQRELFQLVGRLVQARSKREPAVYLLEDLHWFDDASDQFVARFVTSIPGTRSLVLVNFRPEYEAPWMHQSYYQQLPLLPLGPEATREMLVDFLGKQSQISDLIELIHERTRGNPFFVEEVIRSLVESGVLAGQDGAYRLTRPVHEIDVPSTVHSLLAARVDRLSDRDKQVLQTAAVIGRRFDHPLLKRIVELGGEEIEAVLQSLLRAEFLVEEALYPSREFAFRHPLTQEVTYRTLLADRRASVHEHVARILTEGDPDTLRHQAALVAYHWEGAGNALEAARWHRRAAEWIGSNDAAEALRHWRRARELLAPLLGEPETDSLCAMACAQIVMYGLRLGASEKELDGVIEEGRRLAQRTGDLRSLAFVLGNYGAAKTFGGDVDEGAELFEEALRLADESGDRNLRMATGNSLAIAYFFSGSLRDGLRVVESVIKEIREDQECGSELLGYGVLGMALCMRSNCLRLLGRLVEAKEDANRAVELGERRGEVYVRTQAHLVLSMTETWLGNHTAAVHEARAALDVAERSSVSSLVTMAKNVLGFALEEAGRFEEGASLLEDSLVLMHERRGPPVLAASALASLSKARAGMGQRGRAIETAREAIEVAGSLRRWHACEARLALAQALLEGSDSAAQPEVESLLERTDELIQETGAVAFSPQLHLLRADLAALAGDDTARRRELHEAERLFREMGAMGNAERLAKELGL